MPNKIGISLPLDYVAGAVSTPEAEVFRKLLGPPPDGLAALRDWGVRHIELRGLGADTPGGVLHNVWQALADAGMSLSFHAVSPSEDGWGLSLAALDQCLGQTSVVTPVIITVHARAGENMAVEEYAAQTARHLEAIVHDIARARLPVRLALENNRQTQRRDPSTTCTGILIMLDGLDPSIAGICWDFGHMWANVQLHDAPPVPPVDFLRRVIHVHIHEYDGQTHRPLTGGAAPLREYLGFLVAAGYDGVYNLELEPHRARRGFDTDLADSVRILHDTLQELRSGHLPQAVGPIPLA